MTQPAYHFQLLAVLFTSHPYSTCSVAPHLHDGAIHSSHLNARGGYCMNDDESGWPSLLVDQHEQVIGCARYLIHPIQATRDQLRTAQSPLAHAARWGRKLRETVETTLQQTRREQVRYAELGGWDIDDEYRNTKAALEILLAGLWAEMISLCVCSCTATVRSLSSSLLTRVGATSLLYDGEALPSYFDSQYGCMTELLSFGSRRTPPRLLLC